MSGIQIISGSLAALAVTAGAIAVSVHPADVDAGLRAQLEHIAQRRILFGHQSVGMNLLDGVKELAATKGVPVRIAEVQTASSVGPAMFGHTFVVENGDPLRKLQSFEVAMEQQPNAIDIAIVKFCYVDITAKTDVKGLFSRYQSTMDRLRARNPAVIFVHVTAPLTEVQRGSKALVKRLLGRAPYGIVENMRREEYNALLRQAYRGREPIFDLARVESTAPDGTAVTVEWKGSAVPTLASTYTNDGGHLNGAGKLRAARELIAVLAAVPARQ